MEEAKNLIKEAEKYCDYAQVNLSTNITNSLNIKNNKIDSFENSVTKSIFLKVWVGKKVGWISSSNFDIDLVKKAVKIAKSNTDLEYFYGLPEKKKYPNVKSFSEKVAKMEIDDLVEIGENTISKINIGKVNLNNASISQSKQEISILNSNGIYESCKETIFGISITSTLTGKKVSHGCKSSSCNPE